MYKNLVNFGPLTLEFTVMVWRLCAKWVKLAKRIRFLGLVFDNGWQEPLIHQIHTEDVFGPSLGRVGMSWSKVKRLWSPGIKNMLCTHNTPAVWTKWNGLLADNVAQAAGTSIRSLARGVFAGLHSACSGPGRLLRGSATHF